MKVTVLKVHSAGRIAEGVTNNRIAVAFDILSDERIFLSDEIEMDLTKPLGVPQEAINLTNGHRFMISFQQGGVRDLLLTGREVFPLP